MQLLSMKELAWELNRSYGYICAMKKAGFEMPGGRATLQEARDWLRANPDFSFAAVYVRKDWKGLKATKRPKRSVKPREAGQFPSRRGRSASAGLTSVP